MSDDEELDPGPVGLPIGEATRRLLHAHGLDSSITLGMIMSAWEETVGQAVSAHARPCAIHGSSLVVEVDDPTWATQLQFLTGTIVEGLRDRVGAASPTGLTIRVGRRRAGGGPPAR